MDEREYKRRIEAKQRVVPQSGLEKQNSDNRQRQRPERPKKRKYGCFASLVVGLGIVIVALSFFLLFYVQQIKVTGNEYSTSTEIIEWLTEDPMCMNSIAMYVKYNFTEAELPPQVETMSVKILNPWTISVGSIDKTPVGGFIIEEQYVYCDMDGIVLLESLIPMEDLPIIEGVEVEEYTMYQVLPVDDIDILKNALEVTSILNIEEITIDTISCSSGAGVDITIGGILIKLGEDNYQEKIVQLSPILEEIGEEEGTLNLENYSSSNTSISFIQKNIEN